MARPESIENQNSQYKYQPLLLIIYGLTLVIASAYFTFSHYYLNQNFPLATLQAMIEGTAYKPFQFRILVPWLVGALNHLTGVSIFVLYQIVESASVIGLVICFRYFLRSYFGPPLVDICAFGIVLLLPWNYLLPREIALVMPADIPAVMFFALLLALMVRKNWFWYYLIFAVATLNRETTCFVTLVFLFAYWKKLPTKDLFAHLGAQLLIWAAIKTWLAWHYAENPGAQFEMFNVGGDGSHFSSNIEFLTSPIRILILLSSFGFLWIPVWMWWRLIRDQFMKRALLALVPFCFVMLIIGNLNEIRIFGEWLPLVLGAILIIARELSIQPAE